MRRKIFSLFVILLTIGGSSLSNAATVYVGDHLAGIYSVETDTGVATLVGNSGSAMTDIAFDLNGNLWGVTFDSLYRIDKNTAASTLVGSLGSINSANALIFAPDGSLFTAGWNSPLLYAVNTTTGAATAVGNMGRNSSGDLEFDGNGTMFMASRGATDSIVQVNPNTGAGTLIGNTSFGQLYGLTYVDDTMFGFTRKNIISINLLNGSSSIFRPITGMAGNAWGASLLPVEVPPSSPVPEPTTLILLNSGLLGLAYFRRKNK